MDMFRLQVDSSLTRQIHANRGVIEIQAPPIARWSFFGGKWVPLSVFWGTWRTWLRFSDRAGCKLLRPKMLHKFACFGHESTSSTNHPLRNSCLELGKHKHLQWTGLYDQFPITEWSLKPVELKGSWVYFCRLQPDAAVPITSSRSMRLSSYDADGNIAVAAVLDFQRFLENWTRSWPFEPFYTTHVYICILKMWYTYII